jgi:hypothetical protein
MVTTGTPFQPGNKFGRGRPRGSRNKKTLLRQELLDTYAEALLRKAALLALQGDVPMLRALLPYLLPRRQEQPVKMGPLPMGTAEELSQASQAIITDVAAGKLTPHQAREMSSLLETRRRVIELQEFDARLRAIEQREQDHTEMALRP